MILQLVIVNKTLSAEVETLVSSTEQAKLRLQLLIQWWEEFHGNHGDVVSWLDEAERSLRQLIARYVSTQPPRTSPGDVLEELKVRNDWRSRLKSKSSPA